MKYGTIVPTLILLPLATACGSWPASREPTPPPPREAAPVATAPAPETVVVRDPELEQRLALSKLLLLEKESQVDELQARLDDARQEVVRAMARQQSLASRAEAASAIAEAEIALQSLGRATGAPGVAEVDRLIKLSTAEFDRQNYAGALYLASQAKSAAFAARGKLANVEHGPLRAGERPFMSPLRLQTSARANLRDGPGETFRVLLTLPAGAPLTGLSHTQQWVRVNDEAGREGWVYQGLIDRRP